MEPKLDGFVAAFVEASRITLRELCKTELAAHQVFAGDTLPKRPMGIAGVIGITSPSLSGSISVEFPKPVFLAILNSMLGESKADIEPGLEDGAAEITNIILGHAKSKLNEAGYGIESGLPTLLTARTLESTGKIRGENRIGIEFSIPGGEFQVVIELMKKSTDPEPPKDSSVAPPAWTADALLEFVKAVRKTLEVQFGTSIEIGSPFLKSSEHSFTFDVGSLIGVTEEGFSGYFGMYYQTGAFLGLMNRVLGTTYTELNQEIQDGASEVTNICFGVAKQVLNEQGHRIQMALPYLICGSEIASRSSAPGQRNTIVVPLSTDRGKLWIEFGHQERS